MKNHFLERSVVILSLIIASSAFAFAQQPEPSPQASQSNQPQPGAQAQNAQQFAGTIVRQGKSLMLKDSYGALAYKLDDQGKAQSYVGKRVKINGTLDSSTHVLHVQSIQTGS